MVKKYGGQKQEQKQTVIVKIGDTEKKKRRKRRKKAKRMPPPPAQVVQTFRPERYSFVPRTFPANPPDPLRQQVASRESISNPLSQRSSYSNLQPPPSVVASQAEIMERIRASAKRSATRVQEKEEELRREQLPKASFGGMGFDPIRPRGPRTPSIPQPVRLDARMAEEQLPEVHTEPPPRQDTVIAPPSSGRRRIRQSRQMREREIQGMGGEDFDAPEN